MENKNNIIKQLEFFGKWVFMHRNLLSERNRMDEYVKPTCFIPNNYKLDKDVVEIANIYYTVKYGVKDGSITVGVKTMFYDLKEVKVLNPDIEEVLSLRAFRDQEANETVTKFLKTFVVDEDIYKRYTISTMDIMTFCVKELTKYVNPIKPTDSITDSSRLNNDYHYEWEEEELEEFARDKTLALSSIYGNEKTNSPKIVAEICRSYRLNYNLETLY